jgi:sortase A
MTPRILVRLAAVSLVVAGLFFIGRFAFILLGQRGAETAQAEQWKQLVDAAAGPEVSPPAQASTPPAPAESLPGGIYLRLTVDKLHKDGIGVDGDWNTLRSASMVHYKQSPAPGRRGNVLIAFHRETHWYDIDQVKRGDTVQVETSDRHTYKYVVDLVTIVPPANVDLLKPTGGSDLTLITCDPVWQDYNRMIFRAHQVTG